MKRIRELDFLRGIAILLVLLRHFPIWDFTRNMGWTGVDLFFVLSGFLVSQLIFREYQQFGSFKPIHFLIRRGFKIYPTFYLLYPIYLFSTFPDGGFRIKLVLTELLYVTNYWSGWGYAFGPSWSLAVEEQFYLVFAMAFFVWQYAAYFAAQQAKPRKKINGFVTFVLTLMVVCWFLRLSANLEGLSNRHIWTATHLRISTLLAGVLISYLYLFHLDRLTRFYAKNRRYLLFLALLSLSWTPFVNAVRSFFVKTVGFQLVYIGFSILLLEFILNPTALSRVERVLSRALVSFICKVGIYSYAIYLVHIYVVLQYDKVLAYFDAELASWLGFVLTTALSIVIGKFLTEYVERYFLDLRDRMFPRRASIRVEEVRVQ